MRILLVSHRYPPRHTAGTELYAARLAGELVGRRHEVRVLCTEKDVARRDLTLLERVHAGVPVTELVNNLFHERFRQTWDRPQVDGLFGQLLDRWRPDVVHLQHLIYLSIGCAQEAAHRGVPVVFTLHDFWLQCPRFGQRLHADGSVCETIDFERCGACLTRFKHSQSALQRTVARSLSALREAAGVDLLAAARAADRFLRRRTVRAPAVPDARRAAELAREVAAREDAVRSRLVPAVDLFLSPSRYLLERFVHWGLPRERIRQVPYGVEMARSGPQARTRSERLRVTFLGTLAAHKGPHVLVQAWALLPAELRARGDLDLYGPGGGEPAYMARLAQAARACGARLHGRIAREGVASLLAATDLLVVPSLWYENQPLVILEALAAGTPLAVSDHGGMAELVRPGESGFRFRPGDAADLAELLGALLRDPAGLEQLYGPRPSLPDVATAVDQVEAAYAEVLGARGGVAARGGSRT